MTDQSDAAAAWEARVGFTVAREEMAEAVRAVRWFRCGRGKGAAAYAFLFLAVMGFGAYSVAMFLLAAMGSAESAAQDDLSNAVFSGIYALGPGIILAVSLLRALTVRSRSQIAVDVPVEMVMTRDRLWFQQGEMVKDWSWMSFVVTEETEHCVLILGQYSFVPIPKAALPGMDFAALRLFLDEQIVKRGPSVAFPVVMAGSYADSAVNRGAGE